MKRQNFPSRVRVRRILAIKNAKARVTKWQRSLRSAKKPETIANSSRKLTIAENDLRNLEAKVA